MDNSINKNIILSLPDQDISYEIYSEGQLVYGGKAYKSPSRPSLDIDITKKVRDYLGAKISSAWTTTDGVYTVSGAVKTFTVYAPDSASSYDYTFLNDWTGDWTGNEDILSEPVNGKIDPRMKIFWGRVSNSADTVEVQMGYPNYHIDVYGNMDFDYSAQSGTLTVVCDDVDAYSVGTTETWFTVQKNGAEIQVSVLANSGSTRSGNFYVSWIGGDFTPVYKYYEITQGSLEWEIEVSPTALTFDYSSGSTTVDFSANGPLEWLSISGETWLSGSFQGDINIDHTVNTTGSARTGSVGIYALYPTEQLLSSITAEQDYYYFNIASSTFTVPASGEVITIPVETNASSVTITSASWATATYQNGNIILSVQSNENPSQRSTGLPVFTDYSNLTHTPEVVLVVTQEARVTPYEEEYLSFEVKSGSGDIMFKTDFPAEIDLSYKVNNGEWAVGKTVSGLLTGDIVKWKGINSGFTRTTEGQFSASTVGMTYEVYGNIMSLLYGDDFIGKTVLPAQAGAHSGETFAYLFRNNVGLYWAHNLKLPATQLSYRCYGFMFEGCIGLMSAPDLPAGTLTDLCYYRMFKGCTYLQNAPTIGAITAAKDSMDSMFYGCTSLSACPDLSITVVDSGSCRNMFYNCSSLVAAPAVPANNTSNESFMSMFENCTSLTTAPALPATVLNSFCYYNMFKNCTALTAAPDLPASELVSGCYYGMFEGCTGITYIKCLATNPSTSSNYLTNWVKNVGSTGTFVKDANTSWSTASSSNSYRGRPVNWTVQDA